ncbi:MAG: 50S ribosomal protein L14 [Candidatus Organicella extenuata]|jgi:large subunit ribosomal protein L14|uniref:Large ribosomal subunit protein uL14 n=1 Tax=Candidatus Organicella extenuata TaxID=2841811 RepID=A0AA51GGT3_9BACT|nr:MAG: 50S ribosomal protein L14 [Candidatus Organicella extenuata]
MLQSESKIKIIDNTGAYYGKIIRRLRQTSKRVSIGDLVTIHIIETNTKSIVKKGDVVKAVIVRTKYPIFRKDGSVLYFNDNSAVILDNDKNPRGTRVFGPVARELKNWGFGKIVSLAPEII